MNITKQQLKKLLEQAFDAGVEVVGFNDQIGYYRESGFEEFYNSEIPKDLLAKEEKK